MQIDTANNPAKFRKVQVSDRRSDCECVGCVGGASEVRGDDVGGAGGAGDASVGGARVDCVGGARAGGARVDCEDDARVDCARVGCAGGARVGCVDGVRVVWE